MECAETCISSRLLHTGLAGMKSPRFQITSRSFLRLFLWVAAVAPFLLFPLTMNADPASTNAPAKLQTATFGGGCFWCAEAVFQRIPGVKSVVSGFAGGTTVSPSYKDVCGGDT